MSRVVRCHGPGENDSLYVRASIARPDLASDKGKRQSIGGGTDEKHEAEAEEEPERDFMCLVVWMCTRNGIKRSNAFRQDEGEGGAEEEAGAEGVEGACEAGEGEEEGREGEEEGEQEEQEAAEEQGREGHGRQGEAVVVVRG